MMNPWEPPPALGIGPLASPPALESPPALAAGAALAGPPVSAVGAAGGCCQASAICLARTIVGASSGRGFCSRFAACAGSGGSVSAKAAASAIQHAMTNRGHRTTTLPMRSKTPPGLATSPAPVRLDTHQPYNQAPIRVG